MKYIILSIILVGCGMSQEQRDTYGKEKGKAAEKFFAGDPKPSSPPACQEVVGFSLKGLVYEPRLVTWGEAIRDTPTGKRLISRGEALLLWDSGALKNINFNIGQVWTSSLKDDSNVYLLNTLDGWLDHGAKDNVLGALYVDR